MRPIDCFVSVIAPLSNDGTVLAGFVDDVMAVLRSQYTNYELVLVDDGSTDDTAKRLEPVLARHDCVRVIRLSRRFGEETAIFAGLDTVIGDFVVVMIPNWDPPSLIPAMVHKAREGAEIVFGVSDAPRAESRLMRAGAAAFDWYCRRMLHLAVPDRSTQFRVLSRRAINAVIANKGVHRYLRVLSAEVGFARAEIRYSPVDRGGGPRRRGIAEAIGLAAAIIISASPHPLRMASWLGVLASVLNLLYVVYIVVVYLVKQDIAPGWTTLSMQSAGMFFFVFLILTVMSEYIGHILAETTNRPLYHVLEERTSASLVAEAGRRNIVDESGGRDRAHDTRAVGV
jgi:glycosyltransferase involved in cell wall biosynthesis